MKAVVILPTYNERENIILLLDSLHKAVASIKDFEFTYLVVDDTSPDGTAEVVRDYQKKHQDVVILTGRKEGLGIALLRGMTYAAGKLRADIIVQMDADLSHDPAALPQFFEKIKRGADFVVGSRYIPGGSIPDNWGIHRKLFSIAGNAIVRFGLGFPVVHDWTGGYRVYSRRYLEVNAAEMGQYRGYVFQIAFLHKSILHGAKIAEVPINFTDRRFGRSKIAPSEYIRDVLWYVASARWDSIVHGPFAKFAVVGTIGFIINTAVLEVLVALKAHPAVGSAVGAELAIISNFILNNSWTFRQRKITGSRWLGKFFQFNLTSVGAIIIQAGTVWLGTAIFGLNTYRLFYILGVGIGLIWNYTMYSRVIWRK